MRSWGGGGGGDENVPFLCWVVWVFFKYLSSLFFSGDALDEMLSKREEHIQPITEQSKEIDERYFSIM